MDVFEYLDEEHKLIEARLEEMIEKYPSLHLLEGLEQSIKVFDAIKAHFEKQETVLLESIEENEELRSVVEKCRAERKEILDAIGFQVMKHVDEPNFRTGLKQLLDRIKRHHATSEREFYAKIREHMTAEEKETVDAHLKELIYR